VITSFVLNIKAHAKGKKIYATRPRPAEGRLGRQGARDVQRRDRSDYRRGIQVLEALIVRPYGGFAR